MRIGKDWLVTHEAPSQMLTWFDASFGPHHFQFRRIAVALAKEQRLADLMWLVQSVLVDRIPAALNCRTLALSVAWRWVNTRGVRSYLYGADKERAKRAIFLITHALEGKPQKVVDLVEAAEEMKTMKCPAADLVRCLCLALLASAADSTDEFAQAVFNVACLAAKSYGDELKFWAEHIVPDVAWLLLENDDHRTTKG